MDEFSPPQQQSTLTQNDFSTKRGVPNFKTTLDIESYAIASMHEQMVKSRAQVSRGGAVERIANEFDLSELTTDIPNEYVEAINSGSDPEFETPKHKKAHKKRSSSLIKNSEPAISSKRSMSTRSSKQKLSSINDTLRENVELYYSQVQHLKRHVKVQEKQLEYLRSKLTYISEFANVGPNIPHDPTKDE